MKQTKPIVKLFGILFLMLMTINFGSCGNNVEETLETDCDPEPVVHEIIWYMEITPQQATLTIKPGDTIRWIWGESDMPHNVTSDDPDAPADFGSEIMTGEGSVYEYTFTEETVFDYHCSVHPNLMFGTITVEICE